MKRMLLVFALLMSGCTTINPLPVPTAKERTPIAATDVATKPTLKFASITSGMETGTRVLVLSLGVFCVPNTEKTWSGAATTDAFNKQVALIVSEELKKAKFNLVGDPSNPFDSTVSAKADYLIGGRLVDEKRSMCFMIGGYNGEGYFAIEWSIFDTARKTVVFTKRTEGYAKQDERTSADDASARLTNGALRMSVRNLLADPGFAAAIR